jgi:hypothetical protein
MSNWFHHDHHGRRGRSQLYTNQTICTFLVLKGIFNLTLRATQGLLDSLFELMNMPLCAPDYSCVSKRARTVKVTYRQPCKGRITDLVIDSTGLKVFGEGEWKVMAQAASGGRPGNPRYRGSRSVIGDAHLAQSTAAQAGPCLCGWRLRQQSQPSAYLAQCKGATACIPPRKNAGLWKKGHPRNEAVLMMRKEGLAHWKKISGYHRRSLAETAMYRFKQLLVGKISLRNYNGQVREVMAYVSAINKPNTLGLPVKKPRV